MCAHFTNKISSKLKWWSFRVHSLGFPVKIHYNSCLVTNVWLSMPCLTSLVLDHTADVQIHACRYLR